MVSVIYVVYKANWKILCFFPIMVIISGSLYYFMVPAHKTINNIRDVTNNPIHNHRNESIQGNSNRTHVIATKAKNMIFATTNIEFACYRYWEWARHSESM